MSDLSRHSRHEHLDEIKHIVAIGGGHGLGRVLSALSFMKERLTGIVTTTDNGGLTSRIPQEKRGIVSVSYSKLTPPASGCIEYLVVVRLFKKKIRYGPELMGLYPIQNRDE